MDQILYPMILKRKSFHLFRDAQSIESSDLQRIKEMYKTVQPLIPDIKTDIQIVPANQTTCKRGQEYCILLYSEKKENYLQNIGYIGEQLELLLASVNIGALWFGIGKVEEQIYNGLDFVIMIAIAKMSPDKFRRDMFKSKRKPLDEIWLGEHYRSIGNIVRFAPSACNTQPWVVEAKQDSLSVYRYKKPGKRGIMPAAMVTHYNRIDIGIFLLFLEVCLEHEGTSFERTLFADTGDEEKTLIAKYQLHCGIISQNRQAVPF
ncbi:MAG: nitroreductase [Oscillospiraceae bacterium]|nr:nitroreductase [Oscillospiraceae bacterium]